MPAPAPLSGPALLAVQFMLTLSWTVYATFLPGLVAAAGLGAGTVALLLMLDQAIFVVGDLAAGLAADRCSGALDRLGRGIALVGLLSCAAFLLLPQLAPGGGALLLAVTVVWTLSSSALRAPVFALLGKRAAAPEWPLGAATALLGIGLASALGPLLTTTLRTLAPGLPFALASVALAVAVLALTRGAALGAPPAASPVPPSRGSALPLLGLVAMLAALAFQIHANLNSTPLYKRFAAGPELDRLQPLFWIGFSLAMLPAGRLVKRAGAISVATAGALAGAGASLAAGLAGDLPLLSASQLLAGAGWALVLLPAMSLAGDLGRSGAEGRYTGGLFAILALFALVRIAVNWQQLPADPAWAGPLLQLPPLCWLAVAVALPLIGRRLG